MDSILVLSQNYNISKSDVEEMDLFEYEYNINKMNEEYKKRRKK